MHHVILFAILALIFLGPRRRGKPQSGIGLIFGVFILCWLAMVYLMSAIMEPILGVWPQP
jgi:hypothetical protein